MSTRKCKYLVAVQLINLIVIQVTFSEIKELIGQFTEMTTEIDKNSWIGSSKTKIPIFFHDR